MKKRTELTEEESEIYDLMGILVRRGGLRIGVPILGGALLIVIGLAELSRGLAAFIAIIIGATLMTYGVYGLYKRRENAKKGKDSFHRKAGNDQER